MSEGMKIAALFVIKDGPYNLPFIDLWDIERDAKKYTGPYPVIAHPPCERWGRYWSGGPSAKVKRKLGDDNGCFEFALNAVRKYGGVLEHPEASHAWNYFNLNKPDYYGGWIMADFLGGWTCCVSQGKYGHRAQKMTWLYANKTLLPQLNWGKSAEHKVKIDEGFHSKEERSRCVKTDICQRLSKKERTLTPEPFRDLLIQITRTVYAR